MSKKLVAASVVALAIAVGVVQTARASVIGYSWTGGTIAASLETVGIEFTPNVDISIDALGVFDTAFLAAGGDGLMESHAIGLWQATGPLLVSTTVPSGTGALLIDGFRFVSIGPVALHAGTAYRIGAFFDQKFSVAEGYASDTDLALTGAPEISLTAATFLGFNGINLVFPSFTSSILTAPVNFLFTAAPTASAPEPPVLGLLGFGLAVIWARRALGRGGRSA